MRKLAILTFVSLDGVMQGPTSPDEDPSGGFVNGGWAADCWDEVMEQVTEVAMAEPYDLLLGRKTYQTFAGHFPNAGEENPVAKKLNKSTKYVVTSTLKELDWQNSISVTGDAAAEIAKLKNQDAPLLQVHGSWQLIQCLLANNLIDEFRLWVFPVVAGKGKRLFDSGSIPEKLTLTRTKTCPNGAIMCIYRPRSRAV